MKTWSRALLIPTNTIPTQSDTRVPSYDAYRPHSFKPHMVVMISKLWPGNRLSLCVHVVRAYCIVSTLAVCSICIGIVKYWNITGGVNFAAAAAWWMRPDVLSLDILLWYVLSLYHGDVNANVDTDRFHVVCTETQPFVGISVSCFFYYYFSRKRGVPCPSQLGNEFTLIRTPEYCTRIVCHIKIWVMFSSRTP